MDNMILLGYYIWNQIVISLKFSSCWQMAVGKVFSNSDILVCKN